ncbi:MAG: hypothetical protein PVI03_01575 [Candidatus Thorarchaeota archaeon]|jgi:hypothetical protein
MAGVFNKDWQTVLYEKDERIAELEQENRQLRDALEYAMDYMDSYQQHRMRTELWTELFNRR